MLRDYLSQLCDAAECDAAFGVLRSLTVCDPTVGSGAFLFAALDVLEPLYSEVLERATELEARNQPVPSFLAEARAHPSNRYWAAKTICLHNLFGVDLMRDAPEIAKLRLFLKLAAQVERVEHLKPLPDLDFNIKCGNLLVGIADERDATERLGDGRLDLGGTLANISSVTAAVAADYDSFVALQTETSTTDHADIKARLEARFDAARADCDRLLADLRHEEGDLDHWVSSHQPFHWFVEFPSVWRQGGFDVIIGNPPYIRTTKVKGYRWFGYASQKCPDLYAVCMERAATLLNDQGRFAMIVMHSLCFNQKYSDLRNRLRQLLPRMWVASFARRPDSLFAGSAAVRNSIAVGSKTTGDVVQRLYVAPIRRWSPDMRPDLFSEVEFQPLSPELEDGAKSQQWPRVGRSLHRIFHGLIRRGSPIDDILVEPADTALGHKRTALYQLNVYVDPPPALDPATQEPAANNSAQPGWLHFESLADRDMAWLVLAGRWGYLWWLAFGDEFNVTSSTLAAFPGDVPRLHRLSNQDAQGPVDFGELPRLAGVLRQELPTSIAWTRKSGIDVGRYNMLKLRHVTDRSDWLLAHAWGIEDAFDSAGNLRDRMIFGNKE